MCGFPLSVACPANDAPRSICQRVMCEKRHISERQGSPIKIVEEIGEPSDHDLVIGPPFVQLSEQILSK